MGDAHHVIFSPVILMRSWTRERWLIQVWQAVQSRLKAQTINWRLTRLGFFFEELHNGYLSGCLHFLFVELLGTFQDILHLHRHLVTFHAVGIMLIMTGSLRMSEHERLAQDVGARTARSGCRSTNGSLRMSEHERLAQDVGARTARSGCRSTNGSLRMSEHERLAQDVGARTARSGCRSTNGSLRMSEHERLAQDV
uniref:Uncharacterized protein n=1 Tax=Eptatretus burgeri TaxID=7764 RepID=A0A8C4NBQ2_EPTBU